MSIDLSGVWENEKKMRIASGLTINEAKIIFEEFTRELKKVRRKDSSSKVGRPSKLSDEDIFLMLMIFLRRYLPFDFLGLMFDVSASNVKRWVDDGLDVLAQILVKKNFRHLVVVNQKRLFEANLEELERSTLMDLSSLYADQKTT